MSVLILSLLFIVLFGFIIFGLLYRPQFVNIHIPENAGIFNKHCSLEKVSCSSDADCHAYCEEVAAGENYICRALPDVPQLTAAQAEYTGGQAGNKPPKYCVPEKAVLDCDPKYGGIPVFAGWSDPGRMEFDCMCAYPAWASSQQCDPNTGLCKGSCNLNPGICTGGTFNWDLTKNAEPPVADMCTCSGTDILVIDANGGIPRCVPADIPQFYSDLDISTGRQTIAQPKIKLDVVGIRGTISCSEPTCGTGCCKNSTDVCCSDGLHCCPSDFPICDISNNLCKATACQTPNCTTCPDGFCESINATCCNDGTCCPFSTPVCDPTSNYCNKNLVPLTDDKTCTGIECNGKCCPVSNGSCCGDGENCCPEDYPICDLVNKQCKQRQ
jgi:hypothetical protein